MGEGGDKSWKRYKAGQSVADNRWTQTGEGRGVDRQMIGTNARDKSR